MSVKKKNLFGDVVRGEGQGDIGLKRSNNLEYNGEETKGPSRKVRRRSQKTRGGVNKGK